VAVPTLFVMGSAERLVSPDRVVVSVDVQTPVLRSPRQALTEAVQARRRLLDHLEPALPGAAIADGRVTTREETRRVEEHLAGRTETRWEVEGYTGLCRVTLEDGVARAAEIVAAAGAHPDAARISPRFEVGPELARSVRDELEQEAVRDALARAAGLAAAAGMAVGGIVSIGEHAPSAPREEAEMDLYAQPSMAAPMSADEVAETLGELRPEPEPRSARVPVRMALRDAAASDPPA
jgi:uncharacterized protein YggE